MPSGPGSVWVATHAGLARAHYARATCEPERYVAAYRPLAVPAFAAHLAVALAGQLRLLGDVELDCLPECMPGGTPNILVWIGLG
jgi:hypothetical protein